MGRIRTVKPELFKHEELFEAEMETGLPLRVAFIGLFTCCDKEGRFKWRPRTLKLDILPYDEVEFSRVLDALTTRGFVGQYEVAGEVYGFIPSFRRHQVLNNRETASEIPPPPNEPLNSQDKLTREPRVPDASPTREPREGHAGQGEGKGREGKGRERKGRSSAAHASEPVPATKAHRVIAMDLMDRGKAELTPWERKFLTDVCATSTLTPKMQTTLDSIAAKIGLNLSAITTTWRQRLETARKMRQWDAKWGPMPGQLGCFAPDELLEDADGEGWTEWKVAS